MAHHWNHDGSRTLVWPDGKVVRLQDQHGMSFIGWDDFLTVKTELINSHRKGRPTHPRVTARSIQGPPPKAPMACLCTKILFEEEVRKEDTRQWIKEWSTPINEKELHILPEDCLANPAEGQFNSVEDEWGFLASSTEDAEGQQEAQARHVDLENYHGGDSYIKECGRCRKALGLRRPHRHGTSEPCNVLSVDLSGPFVQAEGTNFIYFLVGVFHPQPGAKNMPFVRGLTGKKAEETANAVKSILAEINSILGEQIVVRLHSDAGGEFMNNVTTMLVNAALIRQTFTEGHDPRANGRAERYVGILKERATAYLVHAGLPMKF